MDFNSDLLWFLLIIVAVAAGAIMIFKKYADIFIELKKRELQLLSKNNKAQINTEAHERMILFLERIKPSFLINEFDKDLKPAEYVYLLKTSIEQEFDYNVSQKLYIEPNVWNKIVLAKDWVIDLTIKSLELINEGDKLAAFKTAFITKSLNEEDKISEATVALQNQISN